MTAVITDNNRQQTMDAWTEARAASARILAQKGKRDDWETWANQQLAEASNSDMVRQLIFER